MTITPININRNVDLIEARVMILGFNIYMYICSFNFQVVINACVLTCMLLILA